MGSRNQCIVFGSCPQERRRFQELYDTSQNPSYNKSVIWKNLEPWFGYDFGQKKYGCHLACKHCRKTFSASNPSQSCRIHIKENRCPRLQEKSDSSAFAEAGGFPDWSGGQCVFAAVSGGFTGVTGGFTHVVQQFQRMQLGQSSQSGGEGFGHFVQQSSSFQISFFQLNESGASSTGPGTSAFGSQPSVQNKALWQMRK